MYIFKTSYNDKKINRFIEESVGKSYSFMERIKLRGIGSKRHVVAFATSEFDVALNALHYQTLVSIELRPKGVLIYFRKKLDNYTAVFPFDSLKIEIDRDVKLSSGGAVISFVEAYEKDSSFFDKVKEQMLSQ